MRRGARASRRPGLALAYHAVDDDWDDPLAVPEARFAGQIARLRELGYTGVRFADLAQAADASGLVAVTFDDAFCSVRTRAFPVLEALGWPATVFASSVVVDAGDPMTWLLGEEGSAPADAETLQPMGWDDLRFLHEQGWEVGSHGATHRRLSSLEPDDRLHELEAARTRIGEEIGQCTSVSYPWGEVVDTVIEAAREAGHTAGSGLAGRFAHGDPMRVPRFAVSRRDGQVRFAAKTSATVSSVRGTMAWTWLERVRRRDYEPAGDARARRPVGSA